jgi:hypothetical protein
LFHCLLGDDHGAGVVFDIKGKGSSGKQSGFVGLQEVGVNADNTKLII